MRRIVCALASLAAVAVSAQESDLRLQKAVSPLQAAEGETAVFSLLVENEGPAEAVGVVVADTLPTGLEALAASPECAVDGSQVQCTLGSLGVGASALFTVDVTPSVGSPAPELLYLTGRDPDSQAGVFVRSLPDVRDAALVLGAGLGDPGFPGRPISPRGVAREPGGTLVVCEAGDPRIVDSTPAVIGDGRILRLDPSSGAVTELYGYGTLANPSGIVVDPGGWIYFVDEHTAREDASGNPDPDLTGTVRRLDPVSLALEIVSERDLLVRPLGLDLDPVDGTLVVADGSGLLLRVDPATGAQGVIASGGLLGEPRAVIFEGPGSLLIADGVAGVLRVDAASGAQTQIEPLGGPAGLEDPWDLAFAVGALHVTEGGAGGALVALDPASGVLLARITSTTWGPLWGIDGAEAYLNVATVGHEGSDPDPDDDRAASVLEAGAGEPVPVQIRVDEGLQVVDSTALLPAAVLAIAEIVGVGDVVSITPSVRISVAEALTVGDSVYLLPSALLVVAETVAVSDGALVLPPLRISVTESLVVGDQIAVLPAARIEVSEEMALSDSPSLRPAVLLVVGESVAVGDQVAPAAAAWIAIGESVSVGEAIGAERRSSDPPRILRVLTAGRGDDGVLETGERTAAALTRLVAVFDEDVYDPPGDTDPDDVSNPANWLVLTPGPDGVFQTVDCAGGRQGDDQEIGLAGVTYRGDLAMASLAPERELALASGKYRLLACGSTSITDLEGTPLDGDGDGVGGDDFVLPFTIVVDHLPRNPNFDEGIDPWSVVAPPGTAVVHSPDDAGGIPTSGSALADNLGQAVDLALYQCLSVTSESWYETGVALLQASPSSASPEGWLAVEWWPDAGCQGGSLGQSLLRAASGSTGGSWKRPETLVRAPEGAASAWLTLLAVTSEERAEIWWDEVRFAESPDVIFADGFESGDTGAW